jgi:hypothetical protein
LVACRTPTGRELAVLTEAFARHLARYRHDRSAALKLVSAGEHPRCQELDMTEHAALSATMNLIMNLDEVITKE